MAAKKKRTAKKKPVSRKKPLKKAAKKKRAAKKKVTKKKATKKKATKKKATKKKPAARRPAKKAAKKKATKKPAAKKATKKKVARRKPAAKKKAGGGSGTFSDLHAQATPDVLAIAKQLRKIVYSVLPKAEEKIYAKGWKIALYSDPVDICGIQPITGRCNFYLTHGARLNDPDGLLEGSGKSIRHVKVYVDKPIPTAAIKKLIRAGQKLAKSGK